MLFRSLESRGFTHVRVCSFFDMDKELMRPGDRKLASEDDLAAELSNQNLQIVFGDTDYKLNALVKWVPLHNQGNLAPMSLMTPVSMTDGALDLWLDSVL